jgi:hypothetical protein
MRRTSVTDKLLSVLVIGMLVAAAPASAQNQAAPTTPTSPPQMSKDEIVAFAKIQRQIDEKRDSVQYAFPIVGNKKTDAQLALQERMRKDVDDVLHHNNMTQADYQKKVLIVSTDNAVRKTYDSVMIALNGGVALPGTVVAAGRGGGGRGGAAVAPVPVPAGPVGTHIGHIMNSFNDTPNMAGLLRVAQAEAGVAAQHAGLGARTPDDLAMMKTHAGHVLHALDPTTVTLTAPGAGYGVKKAAAGVASHIELAAGVDGASANVKTHAVHIATAARSTIKKTDQIIELAKKLQAATTAAEASMLFNQIVPLTQQLSAGFDANNDGRITWEDGEGGLQQAEEHVTLLLRAEGSGR